MIYRCWLSGERGRVRSAHGVTACRCSLRMLRSQSRQLRPSVSTSSGGWQVQRRWTTTASQSCGEFSRKSQTDAAALGVAAGLCTGWVGWGAAQILIPGLPRIGATPLQAGALSICTLLPITLSSFTKFWSSGAADVERSAAIGIPAVLCAPIGAILAGKVSGRTLQVAFNSSTSVMMPVMACYFFWASQAEELQMSKSLPPASNAEKVCARD